jgi:hypothetical protein
MIKGLVTILVAVIGFVGVMALALCYAALSWGFVAYKFWGWFIPMAFPTIAIPHLLYYQAIALIMFLDLFKTIPTQQIKKEYKDETAAAIVSVIAPWIVLGVGYFVYAFIIPKVM